MTSPSTDQVLAAIRSIPSQRTAPDDNADREWAATYLSAIHGRPVTGGLRFDELLAKLREAREVAR